MVIDKSRAHRQATTSVAFFLENAFAPLYVEVRYVLTPHHASKVSPRNFRRRCGHADVIILILGLYTITLAMEKSPFKRQLRANSCVLILLAALNFNYPFERTNFPRTLFKSEYNYGDLHIFFPEIIPRCVYAHNCYDQYELKQAVQRHFCLNIDANISRLK